LGIGIATKNLKTLFEEFIQADDSKLTNKYGGFWLSGLSYKQVFG